MAEDAASGWVLTELEDERKALAASDYKKILPSEGQLVSLVALDMDAYSVKWGSRAVKKP